MWQKKHNIIVDLDGTLACDAHRAHLLKGAPEERKWDDYFALCDLDDPKMAEIMTIRMWHAAGYRIHIFSARRGSTLKKTEAWLRSNHVPYHLLILRPTESREDDHIMKLRWAQEEGLRPFNTMFVMEDRKRVVDAWRHAGFTVFQTAPGEF